VLFKHYFCRNKITQTKAKLDKYYGGKKIVLLKFVVVVQARETPNVLDTKLRSLHLKQLEEFTIWCWLIGDSNCGRFWKP